MKTLSTFQDVYFYFIINWYPQIKYTHTQIKFYVETNNFYYVSDFSFLISKFKRQHFVVQFFWTSWITVMRLTTGVKREGKIINLMILLFNFNFFFLFDFIFLKLSSLILGLSGKKCPNLHLWLYSFVRSFIFQQQFNLISSFIF